MYLSDSVVCKFSLLANNAINITPQSVRTFSVPVCSSNLRQYYKDLPVEGIGAVTLWMGLHFSVWINWKERVFQHSFSKTSQSFCL